MKAIFFGFLLICLTGIISCGKIIPGKDYFDRGYEKFKKGDYEEAIKVLDSGIAINPFYSYALLDKGKAYFYLRQYDSAFTSFQMMVENSPKWHLSYFWRGRASLAKDNDYEAIYDFTKTIELKPKFAEGYYFRSLAHKQYIQKNPSFKQDDLHTIFLDLDKAIQLNSNEAKYYNSRCFLNELVEKYPDALNDINKAISIDDKNSHYYSHRALLKVMHLADTISVIPDLYKSLELDSSNALAYNFLGWKCFVDSNYEESLRLYSLAINYDTTEGLYYVNRGRSYRKLNKFLEAKKDYQKAIEMKYNPENTILGLGYVLIELEDFNSAKENFNEVIEINPFNGSAYFGIGRANHGLKKYSDGIENFNKSISLFKTQEFFAEAYYYSGLCKLESGEKEDACLDFSIAKDKGSKEAEKKMEEVCNR